VFDRQSRISGGLKYPILLVIIYLTKQGSECVWS